MKAVSKLVAGGLFVAALAVPAHAQGPYVFFGGGASIPVGSSSDHVKTGWMATGGIGLDIGTRGLFVEAEGYYGQNKAKVGDEKAKLMGGLGAIGYSFMREKKAHPYVLAGAGILSSKNGESESQFAYSGALGLVVSVATKINLWVEGRYLGTKDVKIVPVMGGLSINF